MKKETRFRIAIYGFIAILFIALVLYTQKMFFYWDEVVYIGISKYIFFAGNAGLFEMIRPPIVGFLLSPFAWISESPIILYRGIALAVTFCMVAMVYHITKKYATRRGALFAILMLCLISIFIKYSFRISAGIFALLFMFLSLWLLSKKYYVWAGFFAAIAFLTRFPMGTYAFSLGAIFTLKLIYDIYSVKKGQKKKVIRVKAIKSFFHTAMLLLLGFLIPTIIYLVYNILMSPEKPIFRAALDPFFYASSSITGGYLWLYEQGVFYYAIELIKQMPFLILVPFAVCALIWVQYKTKKFFVIENIIICFTIATFIYFSQLGHKELRYAIIFLPTMCMLVAFAIHHVCEMFNKKILKAYILNTLLIMLVLFSGIVIFLFNPLGLFQVEEFPAQKLYSFECFGFLEEYTNAPVVSTTPFPAVFITNRIYPSYFTLSNVAKLYKDNDMLILTPQTFLCAQDDRVCQMQNDAVIYEMVKESNVLFYDADPLRECMVLTKKEIPQISEEKKIALKEEVLNRFRYQDSVELSITPYAKISSVMVVLNDIVVLDGQDIYKQDALSAVTTVLQQKEIPFSLSVIPKNLDRLDADKLFVLQRLAEKEHIDIIQKGFDYTAQETQDSFAGLPLKEQKERIWTGKAYVYKYLFVNPDSFFVPYGISDQNTINALLAYNYSNIITSSYDLVYTGDIHRFNVGVETVTDWETVRIQNIQEIKKQTELRNLMPYILVNLYYYSLKEQDIQKLSDYVDWLKEKYHLTTIHEYREWENIINTMEYKLTEEEFIVKNVSQYKNMPLGIEVRSSINLITNLDTLYVRNIGFTPAQVCINDNCATLMIEEIRMFNSFS